MRRRQPSASDQQGRGSKEPAKFRVTVKVLNAFTSAAIENVNVWLTMDGEEQPFADARSSERGVAAFSCEREGWHGSKLQVSAAREGWVTIEQHVKLSRRHTRVHCVLSRPTAPDAYNMVLTWGQRPKDLDMHMICPDGARVNATNDSHPSQGASLVTTTRRGFGPETLSFVMGRTSSW